VSLNLYRLGDRQGNPYFETYLHRIGRTDRFGKVWIAINLVENNTMHFVDKNQQHFGEQIKRLDPSEKKAIEKLDK
jgi:superfamily II DNA/RNA helicase